MRATISAPRVNQMRFLSSSALAKAPRLILAANCSAAEAMVPLPRGCSRRFALNRERTRFFQAPTPAKGLFLGRLFGFRRRGGLGLAALGLFGLGRLGGLISLGLLLRLGGLFGLRLGIELGLARALRGLFLDRDGDLHRAAGLLDRGDGRLGGAG